MLNLSLPRAEMRSTYPSLDLSILNKTSHLFMRDIEEREKERGRERRRENFFQHLANVCLDPGGDF